jgi:hypothetical protein
MNITITTRMPSGDEIPFIYHIESYETGLKLIQDSLDLGADIVEVNIASRGVVVPYPRFARND